MQCRCLICNKDAYEEKSGLCADVCVDCCDNNTCEKCRIRQIINLKVKIMAMTEKNNKLYRQYSIAIQACQENGLLPKESA